MTTKHTPMCPDCQHYAWTSCGSRGLFVICRMCNARWSIEVLHHLDAQDIARSIQYANELAAELNTAYGAR
jgi:hypothetical protein